VTASTRSLREDSHDQSDEQQERGCARMLRRAQAKKNPCGNDGGDSADEDPDREIRERQEREAATVYIGFGKVGFYSPLPFLMLPFRWSGTVLPTLLPVMLITASIGIVAYVYELKMDPQMHSLLGFVLGFLLVIMGNFSHNSYDKAVNTINTMVQDGNACATEVLCLLRQAEDNLIAAGDDVEAAKIKHERAEFRRLVMLYFRLACYEVRADMQARKNRYTWLDPEGGVCTDDERAKFFVAMDRCSEREWRWQHLGPIPSFGLQQRSGRFMVTIRPSVVQSWLSRKVNFYATIGFIPPGPVHARCLEAIEKYTRHLSVFITIDRTPLPYSYVQMTATILLFFVFSLPFALVETLDWGTPFGGVLFTYAYYGLYVNACTLRNPFNYDKTYTGIPINAFIQRLECLTAAVLLDTDEAYNEQRIEDASPRSNAIFKGRNSLQARGRSRSEMNLRVKAASQPPSPASYNISPRHLSGIPPLQHDIDMSFTSTPTNRLRRAATTSCLHKKTVDIEGGSPAPISPLHGPVDLANA